MTPTSDVNRTPSRRPRGWRACPCRQCCHGEAREDVVSRKAMVSLSNDVRPPCSVQHRIVLGTEQLHDVPCRPRQGRALGWGDRSPVLTPRTLSAVPHFCERGGLTGLSEWMVNASAQDGARPAPGSAPITLCPPHGACSGTLSPGLTL